MLLTDIRPNTLQTDSSFWKCNAIAIFKLRDCRTFWISCSSWPSCSYVEVRDRNGDRAIVRISQLCIIFWLVRTTFIACFLAGLSRLKDRCFISVFMSVISKRNYACTMRSIASMNGLLLTHAADILPFMLRPALKNRETTKKMGKCDRRQKRTRKLVSW